MPVFPPYLAGVIEARLNMIAGNGQTVNNVLYFENDIIGGSFSDACDEITPLLDAWLTGFADRIDAAFQYFDVDYLDRSEANGEARTDAIGQNGSDATTALPPQTALCVTWKTAKSGRRYRGRTFLAGFTEAQNDNLGYPLAACVADVLAHSQTFVTALAAADVPLVILSRGGPTFPKPTIADPDPDPVTWDPFVTQVTSASVDAVWDTMRSRRPR